MTQIFEKGVERFYPLEHLDFWIEAEENLGLKNSIFIIDNGKIKQYYNIEEGERFFLPCAFLSILSVFAISSIISPCVKFISTSP